VRVALICGPCSPGTCGVGDYTIRLARALTQKGIEAHLISSDNWNLLDAIKVHESSEKAKFDVLHVQYPTFGFGHTFIPQGLALLRSCVVTIHEASQAHILRKLALLPFSIRPRQLIFTSDCERHFAVRYAPWISRVSRVIPITSNISKFDGPSERSMNEILYFGLVMPKKGLESVVALGELVKSSGLPFQIRIIGSCPAKHSAYFADLKSRTSRLPIVWDNDLADHEVAKRLASSSIAYLPYPDGVSERRASFKAALLNGLAVITTRGEHTPAELESVVTFCSNPKEALVAIRSLTQNAEERAKLVDRGRDYGRQFTWEGIAEEHLAVYEVLMGARAGRESSRNEILSLL